MRAPLRRLSRRRHNGSAHHHWCGRWRDRGRTGHYGSNDGKHHAARNERQKYLEAVAHSRLRRRTGGTLWTLRGGTLRGRLAGAGILAVVDARSGDGGRRVGPSLGIRAHAEAAHSDGRSYAGLGEVQPERAEFETATESPSYSQPSLPRLRRARLLA